MKGLPDVGGRDLLVHFIAFLRAVMGCVSAGLVTEKVARISQTWCAE